MDHPAREFNQGLAMLYRIDALITSAHEASANKMWYEYYRCLVGIYTEIRPKVAKEFEDDDVKKFDQFFKAISQQMNGTNPPQNTIAKLDEWAIDLIDMVDNLGMGLQDKDMVKVHLQGA